MVNLRRRKLLENQQSLISGQQLGIENQIATLQQMASTADTFNALSQGAAAMKAQMPSVDAVQHLQAG